MGVCDPFKVLDSFLLGRDEQSYGGDLRITYADQKGVVDPGKRNLGVGAAEGDVGQCPIIRTVAAAQDVDVSGLTGNVQVSPQMDPTCVSAVGRQGVIDFSCAHSAHLVDHSSCIKVKMLYCLDVKTHENCRSGVVARMTG